MKFYKNLYFGEGLEKKKDKIIRKLKSGKYPLTLYLLTLAGTKENQLEFYSTLMLRQKMIRAEEALVVGIASSYEDAIYLVEEITREVYEKTGGADIRSYFPEQNFGRCEE